MIDAFLSEADIYDKIRCYKDMITLFVNYLCRLGVYASTQGGNKKSQTCLFISKLEKWATPREMLWSLTYLLKDEFLRLTEDLPCIQTLMSLQRWRLFGTCKHSMMSKVGHLNHCCTAHVHMKPSSLRKYRIITLFTWSLLDIYADSGYSVSVDSQ